jgi:flagellar protein FliS
MRLKQDPREAYRRVDFDAAITSANPQQLVAVCYDLLIAALGSALVAHQRSDTMLKSQSLTRAMSALTALRMGISDRSGVAQALAHFYEAARRTVLGSVVEFDERALAALRNDFIDIKSACAAQMAA